LNLQPDEALSGMVERLLKALRAARPRTVRQFFALANQHMRWELNDLARRPDKRHSDAELDEGVVPSLQSCDSALSPDARRMLKAIEDLPHDARSLRIGAHLGDEPDRGGRPAHRFAKNNSAAVESQSAASDGRTLRPRRALRDKQP